jgi:hypothetical protein
MNLAFYTFAILREPSGHPQVQGFFDRIGEVLESAKDTDGFVTFRNDWPADCGPRFFVPGVNSAIQLLSVWTSLESAFAFAYRGRHAEALRGRKEWCKEPNWPTYAAWWIAEGDFPTWPDAAERLEYLHDHGPTPFAFSFRQAFDAAGLPAALDKTAVAEIAATVR